MTTKNKSDFLISLLFAGAIILLTYFGIKYLFVWMFPFVLGAMVALTLQRPIDHLTKKTPVSRTVWSIGLVAVIFVILIVVAAILGKRLYTELMAFVKTLPGLAQSMSRLFEDFGNEMSEMLDGLPDSVSKSVREMPTNIIGGFASSVSGILTGTVNFIFSGGPAFIVTLAMSIVACCFVTKDYYHITAFLKRQLSEEKWSLISDSKKIFVTSILKMLKGYFILMFITFAELSIGFMILRIDYAIVVALLVSFVDLLPILGTGTVLIPWTIIDLAMGNYWRALGIAVLYVIVLIVRNIIEPRIIGKQVGLPPIVSLMAMYLGLQLFGLLGMFIVPVIIIIIKSLQDTGKLRIWQN